MIHIDRAPGDRALIFNVSGTPRPQPRPRFVAGRAVSHPDKRVTLWRMAIKREVEQAVGRLTEPLFVEPLKLTAIFTFRPPEGAEDRVGQLHTFKPDADNLVKLCMDVMESCRLFRNDSQISENVVTKRWGFMPGVILQIEPLTDVRAVAPIPAEGARPGWLG